MAKIDDVLEVVKNDRYVNYGELKQALYSDLLELIGEDELDEHGKVWAGEDSMREIGRDDLRATQRQALATYFGVEE